MFLRCSKRRKDGKEHLYWSVVGNRRLHDGRVLQRHVLYLGELSGCQEASGRKSVDLFGQDDDAPKQVALFPAAMDCAGSATAGKSATTASRLFSPSSSPPKDSPAHARCAKNLTHQIYRNKPLGLSPRSEADSRTSPPGKHQPAGIFFWWNRLALMTPCKQPKPCRSGQGFGQQALTFLEFYLLRRSPNIPRSPSNKVLLGSGTETLLDMVTLESAPRWETEGSPSI